MGGLGEAGGVDPSGGGGRGAGGFAVGKGRGGLVKDGVGNSVPAKGRRVDLLLFDCGADSLRV